MVLVSQTQVREVVENALKRLYLADQQIEFSLIIERPRDEGLGDVAVPCFELAKRLRKSPKIIAEQLREEIVSNYSHIEVSAVAGYLNFFWNKEAFIIQNIPSIDSSYAKNTVLANEKIIVEFSGPNTNKPLHLGHMRNNALGESLSRILRVAGADVFKVNIVNDRGVHICKSMLAYQLFGENKTPETMNIKSDHFVGDFYVKYAQWEKEHPEAEEMIQTMLTAWESGDKDTIDLWKLMNHWAVSGIKETYDRTGISFDKIYYESETYKLGKDIVLRGLEQSVFFKAEDGSLRLNIEEITPAETKSEETPTKVFLRADGTSIYITQDLGTAVARHEDFPFHRMIYVVAHEQKRHFEILFYALKQMGYPWADHLYHLSYGMVNLPDGKMKSREGTVVDADDLLDTLTEQAAIAADSAHRKGESDNTHDVASKVALGALHYFLLQINPVKDMVFDAKESLSFNGNTGPYLQYTYARIAGMLRKSEASELLRMPECDLSLLQDPLEWCLVKILVDFPSYTAKAAMEYSPSIIAGYLYDLAKIFNKFYTDLPILREENKSLALARLTLAKKVMDVLGQGLHLLVIPVVERM
ncbi:arginine--tRNA ligase [Entomospira nematocerorum]|uniref:Arginine--tRNA ligase n=1 Tax=Entomospira nematocerorum TaxID=2719987 RepID=A0A968KU17_9SPIO|nr:arginine--tRNA ligase [Entomospira nematocera]NIZ46774.1 arginine--tRNA ligase [Entomospira nematocera]WDI33429.1 arginine--tRNA ligase [Entomospira nematocera]